MKKTYIAPTSTTIDLYLEGEVALNVTSAGGRLESKDEFLTKEKEPGGWNSELWSSSAED